MQSFTEEQKKCIHFYPSHSANKKHLLIEAGAGAGKTAVLMERVKWLLLTKKIDPARLFIVTFSNDAAEQIRLRIENDFSKEYYLNESLGSLHISTIDSFFSDLVNCIYPTWWEKNQTVQKFSMPPKLQLIDESIILDDLKKSIKKYFLSNKLELRELAIAIDFLLSGALNTGFLQTAGTFNYILKALCNDTFLATSNENIRIAASNMHPATQLLLKEFHSLARKEYLKRIQRGEFTYSDRTLFLKEELQSNIPIKVQELIVDEYQDTNHIQHDILYHLVQSNNARMIVVGDPKQSIYGFRNASVDVFQGLKNHFNWEHLELKKNFRSNPKLLNKINALSKITFDWSNPRFPAEFKDSYFYKEALKKYIAENALDPGKSLEDISNSIESLNIVTCSLNNSRLINSSEDLLKKINSVNLENYSIQCYVKFINYWRSIVSCDWNDMVILCEENSDIIKFHNFLKYHNIPVNISVDKNNKIENILEYNVSLSLIKCLAEENDDYDLFILLISPICKLNFDEIENFFIDKKSKSKSLSNVIELIEKYKKVAKDNFFLAWQQLRWEIFYLFNNEYIDINSIHFIISMDTFADALIKKLLYHEFSNELEKKIKLNLSEKPNIKDKKNVQQIIPINLEQWSIKNVTNKLHEQQNSLELKTVHKAKGLEWKHVFFYPKNGRVKQSGKFVTALSERFIDVTWLQDDIENMSILQRVNNPKFTAEDYFEEFNSKGNLKEKYFYPELRKQAELDFERQRVFYTAFTRAITSLTIFQAKRHVQKKVGLRDDISEYSSIDTIPDQKYLEEEVIIKFLRNNFDLTTDKIKQGRKQISMQQKPPWFQDNESFPVPLKGQQNSFSFYDFGPQFINLYEPNFNDKNETNNSSSASNFINDFHFKANGIYRKTLNLKTVSSQIEEDFSKRKTENINELIQKNLIARKSIAKGILYHAAIENKPARANTLNHFIKMHAKKVYHELEVWKEAEPINYFTMTQRNILDLVAIIPIEKLAYLPFIPTFKTVSNELLNFQELQDQSLNSNLVWIVDYKTGIPSELHIEQIINYMEIISQLNIQDSNTPCNILASICYPKKLIPELFTLDTRSFSLNFFDFSNKESICLLMRKNSY
ncbi:UvrD-helicase domain-containing protein [Pigmentibacter sp. JX0631]|uniref:UvrD-helicase domain-containing protein n=1 Tax=Pigmentibacter sp. JX0631 TaxID=2976982 RepID=UPI0024695567|nr:UvrD-helicase domain-containing protein [Pigmentibacter sp. JX0631]WGL59897.1 UvrD-helicase domain-containing protein [Pigmentibacter sp. JX0631]